MTALRGWRSDEHDNTDKHGQIVAHVRDNFPMYMGAAGWVGMGHYINEKYCGFTDSYYDRYVSQNERARCDEVLDGYPCGYPDVLIYYGDGNKPENVLMVFEIKSHIFFDQGQTMRQIKTYLARCPNATGCLVIPSGENEEASDIAPEICEAFRHEGIAVVGTWIVEEGLREGWDIPYVNRDVIENKNALTRWFEEHKQRMKWYL